MFAKSAWTSIPVAFAVVVYGFPSLHFSTAPCPHLIASLLRSHWMVELLKIIDQFCSTLLLLHDIAAASFASPLYTPTAHLVSSRSDLHHWVAV